MTQRIAYPDNPVMAAAWLSFISFAAGQKEARDNFKSETGHDLDAVLGAKGLDRMIDEATGHQAAVVNAFIDWVNANFWGDDPFAPAGETDEETP